MGLALPNPCPAAKLYMANKPPELRPFQSLVNNKIWHILESNKIFDVYLHISQR